MRVSVHFDLTEFGQRAGYGLPAEAYPAIYVVDPTRLPALVKALERLRQEVGPLRILSGWRSKAYNQAVYQSQGQVPTQSQHSEGRAADVVADGVSASDVHATALALYESGELDIGGLGEYPSFTHLDVRVGWDHLARWQGHGG